MKCEQVRSQLADLPTGDSAASMAQDLKLHLSKCAECGREWTATSRTIQWLEHLPEVKPPDGLWEAVESRIAWSRTRTSGSSHPTPRLWSWHRTMFPALAGGIAMLMGAWFWVRNPLHHQVVLSPVEPSATFLCQHISMARGELFADSVALGAISSSITDKFAPTERQAHSWR